MAQPLPNEALSNSSQNPPTKLPASQIDLIPILQKLLPYSVYPSASYNFLSQDSKSRIYSVSFKNSKEATIFRSMLQQYGIDKQSLALTNSWYIGTTFATNDKDEVNKLYTMYQQEIALPTPKISPTANDIHARGIHDNNTTTAAASEIPEQLKMISAKLAARYQNLQSKLESADKITATMHQEKLDIIATLQTIVASTIAHQLALTNLRDALDKTLDPKKLIHTILATDTGNISGVYNSLFRKTSMRWNPGIIDDLQECRTILQQLLDIAKTAISDHDTSQNPAQAASVPSAAASPLTYSNTENPPAPPSPQNSPHIAKKPANTPVLATIPPTDDSSNLGWLLQQLLPKAVYPSAKLDHINTSERNLYRLSFSCDEEAGAFNRMLLQYQCKPHKTAYTPQTGEYVLVFHVNEQASIAALRNMYQQEIELSLPNDKPPYVPAYPTDSSSAAPIQDVAIPQQLQTILDTLHKRLADTKGKQQNASDQLTKTIHADKAKIIQTLRDTISVASQRALSTVQLQQLLALFDKALDPSKLIYKILAVDTGNLSSIYNASLGRIFPHHDPGTISDIQYCRNLVQQQLTEALESTQTADAAPTARQ